ncbi:MAG: hypothetical protein ACOX25_05490 [Caldicoprobacterales bacterium]|nr:hypothetical protein [Clostridiales bacterium]
MSIIVLKARVRPEQEGGRLEYQYKYFLSLCLLAQGFLLCIQSGPRQPE